MGHVSSSAFLFWPTHLLSVILADQTLVSSYKTANLLKPWNCIYWTESGMFKKVSVLTDSTKWKQENEDVNHPQLVHAQRVLGRCLKWQKIPVWSLWTILASTVTMVKWFQTSESRLTRINAVILVCDLH